MKVQRALAKFRRELPGTEKQRDASSRDVCAEDRKVVAEMPGWAAQEIVSSGDSGPAGHNRYQPPRPGGAAGAAGNRKLRVERRGRSAVWSCRHDARAVLSGASISQRVVIFLSVTLAETANLENLLFQARANWYIFQKARQHWLAAFGRGGDDHAV